MYAIIRTAQNRKTADLSPDRTDAALTFRIESAMPGPMLTITIPKDR
jgi:hypothetical protein